MFENVKKYCKDRIHEFDQISEDRKTDLKKVSQYLKTHQNAHLVFVCTHNSRRSQFAQVWATIAAEYYSVESTHFYSAGTESTAFHQNAVEALSRAGLSIERLEIEKNSDYFLDFGAKKRIKCFSKTIDHKSLPKSNFAAVMTCGHAEENCPFLPGADLRIPIAYEDPKVSDGTPKAKAVYDTTCAQIAREVLYIMGKTL